GKVVMHEKVKNRDRIDISQLPAGLYLVNLITNNNRTSRALTIH
ncbi:MAG: T9SS type A sorting domain-containing protein, partial [Flavobacteriales bacterium]|nr:T9SS type A sorting domain-containing protein [Flavobacteriales bacterium]